MMADSPAPSPKAATAGQDRAVRAMTDDGAFRVIAVETTATVRGTMATQALPAAGLETGPQTARLFADLVTGAVLVRETMAPTLRVQGILKGAAGQGSLVADSQPDGTTRGLIQLKNGQPLNLTAGGVLQMMRTLPSNSLHQGIVELSADGDISAGLMTYMQQSEQVVSVIAVGTLGEAGASAAGSFDLAGGYIVQLLPDAAPDAVARMIEKLERLPKMPELLARDGFSAHTLLSWVLVDCPHTIVDERPVSFGCNCSQARLLASLSTLDRKEIVEMVEDGNVLEITCDYCQSEYRISPEQLRGLLVTS
jgi:molecular chaperone Hsp33